MYGWGDDTGAGASGLRSGGYDYASARKAYKDDAGDKKASSMRSRTAGSRKSLYESRIGKTPAPVGKDVCTESTHPIVIATDVTGSMADRPGIIFEKAPLLGKEIERYAPAYNISFVAFGDAYCDRHPLQVRDFEAGEKLDAHISAMYPEGGGGDSPENHDLVAYYYLHHCKIEKAVKPIFIYITDVRSHSELLPSAVKECTGDTIQSPLDSKELLKKLGEKFSVYVLLSGSDCDRSWWEDVYGKQRVKSMSEARDVVEFIIGIVAGEVGEVKDFEMRSSKRHEDMPDRVDRVMKSLKLEDKAVDAEEAGKAKSASKKSSKSAMKSKKLA